MGLGRLGTGPYRIFQAGLGKGVVVLPGFGPRAYAREAEPNASTSWASSSALGTTRIWRGILAVTATSHISAAVTRVAAFFASTSSSRSMGAGWIEE